MTSWAPDRIDIFTVDATNHQLDHRWCSSIYSWAPNAWNTLSDQLGGNLRDQTPAAVAWPSTGGIEGRIDVFAVAAGDLDGVLQRFRWQGDWEDPVALPGQRPGLLANCGPAAVAHAPDRRVDVFAIDNPEGLLGPRTLQHWWINGDEPVSGPESLGGRLWDAQPCTVARLAGPSVDVFAIADDSTLQHWSYTDRWNGPVSRGGHLATGAGACAVSWGGDRLDVFAIGADQTLQHWWVNGDEWNGPETIHRDPRDWSSVLEMVTPTAVSRGPGLVDVFATRLVDSVFGPRRVCHWRYDGGWSEEFMVFEWVSMSGPTGVVREAVEVTMLGRRPVGRRTVIRTDLFAVHESGALLSAFEDPDWVAPPQPRVIPVTSPPRLPTAALYQPYTWQFQAAGVPPYHWTAATLPYGTHLSDSGVLHADAGQITTPGETTFNVQVSDSGHPIGGGSQDAVLLMEAGAPPPPAHGLTLVIQLVPGEANDVRLDPAPPFLDPSTGAGGGSGWFLHSPVTATLTAGSRAGDAYTQIYSPAAPGLWTITGQATVGYTDLLGGLTMGVWTTRDAAGSFTLPAGSNLTVTATMRFTRPAGGGPDWALELT